MYRGYNICKTAIDSLFRSVGYRDVADIDAFYANQKAVVERSINNIFQRIENNVLDAEVIQNEWFPEISANVFISHSHNDLSLAKVFSGWLLGHYGISSFIDSCIWGYANDLLKIFDKKYCWDENDKYYSYEKRNFSTGHVHMMLMTALNKMIDKSECIIFLNTPNSNVGEGIKSKTLSPWIYGEIETSRLIEKRLPMRKKIREYSQGGKILTESQNLQMKYPLNIGHFYTLSSEDLIKWNTYTYSSPQEALDKLYSITSKKQE